MSTPEETPEVKEEREAPGKERFKRVVWFMLLVLAGLAIFSSFLLMVIGFSQVTQNIQTTNGTSIFLNGSTCSHLPMNEHRPFKWSMEATGDEVFYCPWPSGLSAFRSIICFFPIGIAVLFIFALLKKSPKFMWLFVIGSASCSMFFFIALCADGTKLSKGSKFCGAEMPGAPFIHELDRAGRWRISCHPGSFVGLMFADALAFISHAAICGFSAFYIQMIMSTGNIEDKDLRKPILSNEVKPNSSASPSLISDEILQQDVTGANPFDPKSARAKTQQQQQQPSQQQAEQQQ